MSYPSQRGARFQWSDEGTSGGLAHEHGGRGEALLELFVLFVLLP